MKIRILLFAAIFLFVLSALAAAAAVNWQNALSTASGNYLFNPNSVHTVGTDDVIQAQLRLELSDAGIQKLMERYAATQDTASWTAASYVTSVSCFNLKDRITTVKNICIYDADDQLLAEIPEEQTLDMTAGSTQEKLASFLVQWLYEN